MKLDSLEPLLDSVEKYLKKEDYTLDEIKEFLEITDFNSILSHVPYYDDVIKNNTTFSLYKRLKHVVEESIRVNNFKNYCDHYNNISKISSSVEDEFAQKLGQLMNQSHASCRDLYDCSSNQLDKLTKFCIDNKALGSRLTGAGWGGCLVSVVKNEDLESFLGQLKEYYKNDIKDTNVEDIYFKTKPGQGAGVYLIQTKSIKF